LVRLNLFAEHGACCIQSCYGGTVVAHHQA
jgi:hypothetical protein